MTFCATTLDFENFSSVVFCKELTSIQSVKKVLNWICRHLKSWPFSHHGLIHYTDLRMWFFGTKFSVCQSFLMLQTALWNMWYIGPFKTNIVTKPQIKTITAFLHPERKEPVHLNITRITGRHAFKNTNLHQMLDNFPTCCYIQRHTSLTSLNYVHRQRWRQMFWGCEL